MEKRTTICDYSHDYDGFAFVEDDCECAVCINNGKYYLCCEVSKKINYGNAEIFYKEFALTDEELKLTKRELCIQYCQNKWAKAYNIHNRRKSMKDDMPIIKIMKQLKSE